MPENAAPIRDPRLDAASVDGAEYPAKPIERIAGIRLEQFQAVVKQSVLDDIHAHGKSSPEAEICGVLVGNVFRDVHGPYLYIHAGIRGDQAQGRAAQVTFKAETWTHIQDVMERLHPDAKIVGWYHTHPGFGIFLSGMDLFIQDNFFNLPWQVAFVYDPLSEEEGLFVWRGGKCEREAFLLQDDTLEENQAKPGYEWKSPNESAPPQPLPAKALYKGPGVWLAAVIAFGLSFMAAMWFIRKPAGSPDSSGSSPSTSPAGINAAP